MPQYWDSKKDGDLMLITELADMKLNTQEDRILEQIQIVTTLIVSESMTPFKSNLRLLQKVYKIITLF